MSGEVTAGADRGAVNETTVNFKGRESSVHFNPTAQSPRIAGPVFDQVFPRGVDVGEGFLYKGGSCNSM